MHITFDLVVYTAKPILEDTFMVQMVSLRPRETELSVVINSATWTCHYIYHFICSSSDQSLICVFLFTSAMYMNTQIQGLSQCPVHPCQEIFKK